MRGKAIAQKSASAGIDVTILELSEARALEAREELRGCLDHELEKWGITEGEKASILRRVRFVAEPRALEAAELVVESIPESLEPKKQVMRMLGQVCGPDCVFITTTSTLSLVEIAAASGRPEQVVGMHFLAPVTLAPLVEIVRGLDTSAAAFALAKRFAQVLEKEAIEVYDSPGYVTTRAMMPFLNEAMHLVLEGVASASDVDKAIRLGYDFRLGPLEYADRVGLDKIMTMMEHLFREFGDPKFRPCPLLRKLVRAGRLGRRSGQGFFRYDGNGVRQ